MRITRLAGLQLLLPILGLLFLWPAALNRGPFYFSDTFAYIHAASSALNNPLHIKNEWSKLSDGNAPHEQASNKPKLAANDLPFVASPYPADSHGPPITLGRSIYFGLFLYLGILLHSLWVPIAIQAIISASVIIGVVRHFVDPSAPRFFALAVAALGLAAITPMPYFACFLMPDILGACASVGALMLAVGWRRETAFARVLWGILILAGVLSHSAIILVMFVAAGLCVALAMTRRPGFLAASIVLGASAIVGVASEGAFVALVQHSTGRPPMRIPFLTARLVADGPGLQYLDATCPQNGFLLCRFRQRLPQTSDDFLWSPRGVFAPASPGAQRLISGEQGRFAFAVFAHSPGATLASFVRDTVSQLGMTSLSEFNYSPNQIADIHNNLPPDMKQTIASTAAAHDVMPTGFVSTLVWPLTALSVALIFATFIFDKLKYARWYAAGAVALVFVNAAIFGCLSTPHDRYEARLVWVLPLIAFLTIARKISDRKLLSAAARQA